jgi:hypothetical protein
VRGGHINFCLIAAQNHAKISAPLRNYAPCARDKNTVFFGLVSAIIMRTPARIANSVTPCSTRGWAFHTRSKIAESRIRIMNVKKAQRQKDGKLERNPFVPSRLARQWRALISIVSLKLFDEILHMPESWQRNTAMSRNTPPRLCETLRPLRETNGGFLGMMCFGLEAVSS